MKITNILIISSFALLFGCSSTKGPYVYQVCVPFDGTPGIVLKDEIVDVIDTTYATISGTIVSKDVLLQLELE